MTLFGPLTLAVRGEERQPGRTEPGRWLLGLLTLRAAAGGDGWVLRDKAAEHIWPGDIPDVADWDRPARARRLAARLRTALSELRAALGAEAGRLESQGGRIRLVLSGADVDVARFDAAARGLRADDPAAAPGLEDCRAARRLHAGPLLEGCALPWLEPERSWRERALLRALRLLAAEARSRGDAAPAHALWAESASVLRGALARNPGDQVHVRELMRALSEAGDRDGARRAYAELLRHLEEGDGVDAVEPATRAAFDALERRSAPAVGRRLRAAGEGSPAPPAGPHNLPHPLTRLVGRERDARTVAAWLAEARLVTLVGCGGIGKTRLAVEIAHRLRPHYAHGAWMVDLAGETEGGQVGAAILRALPAEAGRDAAAAPLAAAQDWLRHRSALLLLDNCEHLVGSCARTAAQLLHACPRLHVLATSRERLAVRGEVVSAVGPLDGASAEALLLERLRLAGAFATPDAQPTLEERDAVARIGRRLDGIPLALELAAARVEASDELPAVAESLAADFSPWLQALGEGARDLPPRHQTMEACLSWSYELLNDAERGLLQALAVFAGGGTEEAIRAVYAVEAGAASTAPFARLVRSGFALEDRPGGANGQRRFRLLEPVRQFVLTRLTEAAEARLRRRHRDYFLEAARIAEEAFLAAGPPPGVPPITDEERDNLRAALLACADDIEETAPQLLRAPTVWRQWFRADFSASEAGRRWLAWLLKKPVGSPDALSRHARTLLLIGRLLISTPAYQEAHRVFAAGLAAAEAAGDARSEGWHTLMQGHMAVDVRDWAEAGRLFTRARELFLETGDDKGVRGADHYLRDVATGQGDVAAARAAAERICAGAREMAQRPAASATEFDHLATSLFGLAQAAEAEGDWATHRTSLVEALGLYLRLEAVSAAVVCLNGIGISLLHEGGYRAAAVLFGGAATLSDRLCCGEKYKDTQERHLERARTALGPDFTPAWDAGAAMDLSALVAFAIREANTVQGRGPGRRGVQGHAPLFGSK